MSRRAVLAVIGGLGGAGLLAAGALWWRPRRHAAPAKGLTPPTTPPPLPPQPPADERPRIPDTQPIVRVRIRAAGSRGQAVSIGSPGQWLRVTDDHTSPDEDGFALRGPLRVAMAASGWSIIDDSGLRPPIGGTDPVIISPALADSDEASVLALDDRQYPGMMRLVARSEVAPAAFDVVNHVALEQYLPGVVAKELYNHWHIETHAAQAIAARSFACAEHQFFARRRHFDMTDSQSSQVYAGAVSHQTSIDAVQITHGEVLAFGDLLVPGYYSSCCGGTAARAIDAIGPNPINDMVPLHGRDEPDICGSAPVCRWNTQRPIDMLTQRLVAYGKRRNIDELIELTTLASIETFSHNEHGRPIRYLVTDVDSKSAELSGEVLRRAANYADDTLHRPARALRSSHFSATVVGDDMYFEGYGYGHGVGLCQHGAQIRARAGADHREILEWYYPKSQIVSAYA